MDPDETGRYEPSHVELHCLQRYLLYSPVEMKVPFCTKCWQGQITQ